MSDDAARPDAATPRRERGPVGERRNWLAVARKDFADAVRAWQLYALAAGFVALLSLPVVDTWYAEQRFPDAGPERDLLRTREAIEGMVSVLDLAVPLAALMLGYMAVVGERERGSLRTLLGLPVSRGEVLVGKWLGRTSVVCLSLVPGLAVAGLLTYLLFDTFSLLTYLAFGAMVAVLAAVFTSVAVGISAATGSRGRALGTSIAAWLTVTVLWSRFPTLAHYVLGGGNLEKGIVPPYYAFLRRARPQLAWQWAVTDWVVVVLPKVGDGTDAHLGAYAVEGARPFYLEPWFLFLVVLAWGVVPMLVGYRRFGRADVG